MPWIEHLPAVGDCFQQDIAALQDLADQAIELERRAMALRSQIAAKQTRLLFLVMQGWSHHDIQLAKLAERLQRQAPLFADEFLDREIAPLRTSFSTELIESCNGP